MLQDMEYQISIEVGHCTTREVPIIPPLYVPITPPKPKVDMLLKFRHLYRGCSSGESSELFDFVYTPTHPPIHAYSPT
jgi:hypothetical protein